MPGWIDSKQLSEGLAALADEMRANSQRWFPTLHDGHVDLDVFYAVGLIGEAGEVANEVKKAMRRMPTGDTGADLDWAADYAARLAAELADVFTYLLLLAAESGVDLIDEYQRKVVVNEMRWG